MGQLGDDRIATPSHSGGIITLPPSLITLGGRQKYTGTLQRTISADVTLVENSAYYIYVIIFGGVPVLRISPSDYVTYKASNPTATLVGVLATTPLNVPSIIALEVINAPSGLKLGWIHSSGSANTSAVNHHHAHRFVAGVDAYVNRISFFLANNTGGKLLTLGLYADTGAGLPGAKLSQTSEYTTAAPEGRLLYLNLQTPVFIIKGQTYWPSHHSSSTIVYEISYSDVTTGGQKYRDIAYSSTLPSPFGAVLDSGGTGALGLYKV